MRTYFAMLLIGAIVSFLVTPLARRLAFVIGAVDKPDPRKIHRAPTARTGGWAVIAGFCAPWVCLYLHLLDNQVVRMFQTPESQQIFLTLLASGLVMFGLGVLDDLYSLNPKTKLAVQIAVAVAMYYGGFKITKLTIPFATSIPLVQLELPFTVLWIVGITNATNLLDGMDGLVAGVAGVMALSLAMIHIINENFLVALLTFSLAGAVLGFLPYNFTPARIFLGDSGSLFIGIIMAGISTTSQFKAATASLFFIAFLLLFAVPLFDTTQVVIGRLRRGQHPFSPDKTHIHHRLLRLGLNQRQAAILLYIITLFLGVAAILLTVKVSPAAYATLALTGILFAGILLALIRWVIQRRHARIPPPPHPPSSPLPPPTQPGS